LSLELWLLNMVLTFGPPEPSQNIGGIEAIRETGRAFPERMQEGFGRGGRAEPLPIDRPGVYLSAPDGRPCDAVPPAPVHLFTTLAAMTQKEQKDETNPID
jgi:hypothetical protein